MRVGGKTVPIEVVPDAGDGLEKIIQSKVDTKDDEVG